MNQKDVPASMATMETELSLSLSLSLTLSFFFLRFFYSSFSLTYSPSLFTGSGGHQRPWPQHLALLNQRPSHNEVRWRVCEWSTY